MSLHTVLGAGGLLPEDEAAGVLEVDAEDRGDGQKGGGHGSADTEAVTLPIDGQPARAVAPCGSCQPPAGRSPCSARTGSGLVRIG